jgi:hypothetical protein
VPRRLHFGLGLRFRRESGAGWLAPLVLACASARSEPSEREGPAPAPPEPTCAEADGAGLGVARDRLPPELAKRFAELALACIHREYPNKIAHVLASDEDVAPPRALTPAFFGCFDWHSAVHGHWLLVRLLRLHPEAPFADRARDGLARSLTPENVAAEVAYLERPDRAGFERPYGLAWLLQLAAELRQWDDPDARRWANAVVPLEALAVDRLRTWLPKLTHPIRSGEHAQTGFALGLAFDWACVAGDEAFASLVAETAHRFHEADRDCNLGLEPSGHDFLSPCLGAADLMRRVLPADRFARWLDGALPTIPRSADVRWLDPVTPTDRSDGKLVHLDGLNLSRAWMLEGIAAGLPRSDRRRAALLSAARTHASEGLAAVTGEHYTGGHWLASFAVYLTSGRGIARSDAD